MGGGGPIGKGKEERRGEDEGERRREREREKNHISFIKFGFKKIIMKPRDTLMKISTPPSLPRLSAAMS